MNRHHGHGLDSGESQSHIHNFYRVEQLGGYASIETIETRSREEEVEEVEAARINRKPWQMCSDKSHWLVNKVE